MNGPTRAEIERATAEYLARGGRILVEAPDRRGETIRGRMAYPRGERGRIEDSAGATLEGMGAYNADPRSTPKKKKVQRSPQSLRMDMIQLARRLAVKFTAAGWSREDTVLAIKVAMPAISQLGMADAVGTSEDVVRRILNNRAKEME